jgi:hypothetical protein
MTTRTADPQGYSTKVTRLGDGYGVRVLQNGVVVSQDRADSRLDVGPVLKDMLRMLNKCGSPSTMAEASRHRSYRR